MTDSKTTWYEYGALYFNYKQVEWILDNLVSLENGYWPKEPLSYEIENPETAYTTGSAPPQLNTTGDYHGEEYQVYMTGDKASFVKPALIAAEITARMGMCGKAGQICQEFYEGKEGMKGYEDEIENVKRYICGWNRKDISFWVWKKVKGLYRGDRK